MINSLTLNPALDQILFIPHVTKDIANRVKSSILTIGGKGTHISIDLAFQGMNNRAFGFCHGDNGKKILDFMNSYEGIEMHFLHREGAESRTNYLVIEDDGTCTILAGVGIELSQKDVDDIVNELKTNMQEGDSLVISGDPGKCSDPDIYNTILKALSDLHIKAYVDASEKTLKNVIHGEPYLIKPNQDELESLCGFSITDEKTLLKAVHSLDKYHIPVIAVSLGGNGSLIKKDDEIYRVTSPKVKVCNTIGCGDCFLTGLIYGFETGMEIENTLSYAAAISASCAESLITTCFDKERARMLQKDVKIHKI